MSVHTNEGVVPDYLLGIDELLDGHRQFLPAPPKRFLYPAVLLLLAESPAHGYQLVKELNELGLSRTDRPGVYRALAELERDGLLFHSDEVPMAGSTRHVYTLTTLGQNVLEAWMSVIARERTDLDRVLRRFWDCNASKVATLNGDEVAALSNVPSTEDEPHRERLIVASDRSRLVVEARTNIGPVAFSTNRISGWVDIEICGGVLCGEYAPEAEIEVQIEGLSSGNPLYDRELSRRIDAQRFPIAHLHLEMARQLGSGNCFLVEGDLTIHGVTVSLQGRVTAALLESSAPYKAGETSLNRSVGERLCVAGEQVLDVRLFNLQPPQMPIFKFYPDVVLSLQMEADRMGVARD